MDAFHVSRQVVPEHALPYLLLYIGPDTLLPLTSALAAMFGFLLIVWRQALALVRKAWRFVARKPPGELTETVAEKRK